MQSIQTLVPGALASLLREGTMSQAKLEVAWRVAVGDALNRATTVRLHAPGLVEVDAADQRWQREVTRSRAIILARLRSLLGEHAIERLVVAGGQSSPRRKFKDTHNA